MNVLFSNSAVVHQVHTFINFKETAHAVSLGLVMWLDNKSLNCHEKKKAIDFNGIYNQEIIGAKSKNCTPSLTRSLLIMFWGHKKIPNYGLHFFFGSTSYLTSSRDYIKRSKCWNEDYFEIMG